MSRVLIVSSRADTADAEQLRVALADFSFDVGHIDDGASVPRLKEWDCVLLCWSSHAASIELGGRGFLKKAAHKAKLVPILLDATPPPVGLFPVDLSRWKGGRSGTALAILNQRIQQVAAEARHHRTRWRIFGGAGAVVIIFSVFEFRVNLAEMPSKACAAGYASSICSRYGVGGVPTSAQETEYQKALAGGCESLRRFISSAQGNPRRADAQAKYEARGVEQVESWEHESRELALHVMSEAAGGEETNQALAKEASGRAQTLCRGFEAVDGTYLTAAAAKLGAARCERFSDGWRCSTDGVAKCSLLRRNIVPREVCR